MLRTCAVWLGLALPLCGQVAVPPIWPQIQGIFPRGGQQGQLVEVKLSGRNLDEAREVVFVSPKLKGRVRKASAYEALLQVEVGPDAEPGRHDFRLLCGNGSALGYFDVNHFAERFEKEPNDSIRQAEALDFPALINGILRAGDYDYFRFEAKAGEVITFDVLATRNGANTDAALALVNAAGEELAYNDDHYGFKDPHLKWRAPVDGVYWLRVYGSHEAGAETHDYRLVAGRMPHVDLAMPAGGQRGKTVEVELRGVNLAAIQKVTLGDGLAKGEILAANSERARVRIPVPADARPGEYRLHVGGASLPVPFVISEFPELQVADKSARHREKPKPIRLPQVVNGVLDEARATDHFVFEVDEAKTVVLDVEAMRLGYLTDPLVLLYDEAGKRLAYQDDPTTNTGKEPANMDPHLVFRLPKAGRYIAAVRDAQFRGDPAFLYRLTLKEAEPDFTVQGIGTDDTLYRGRDNKLLVRVRRLEGWQGPVEVWAEDLPAGVSVEKVVAEPVNTPYTGTCGETHYLDGTNVELVFRVAKDAPLQAGQVKLMARGTWAGKTVQREGTMRYFRGRIRHIGDAQETTLRVTVADAPGAVLATPQAINLDAKGAARFTVVVTRLDEAKAPLELELESAASGWRMEAVKLAPGETRADIRLVAGAQSPGEFRIVGRVEGAVVGRSHPVQARQVKQ